MKDNVYIGARYVVSPEGEYDPLKEYDSLSMVSYENSGVYVSRQPVPVNTPPTKGGSDSYWALMFPVDPQIKDFEKQLQDMAAQLNNAIADMREEIANNNQNVLDQIAAKFAQQDAAITKLLPMSRILSIPPIRQSPNILRKLTILLPNMTRLPKPAAFFRSLLLPLTPAPLSPLYRAVPFEAALCRQVECCILT